jgi:hypothetical protein
MEYFAGLDVSLRSCALCIVDNKGKVMLERELPCGVCQRSCPPISCGVSDFRGACFAFGVKPDGSGWSPVAGFA